MELHVTSPNAILCDGMYSVPGDPDGEKPVVMQKIAVIRVDDGAHLTVQGSANEFVRNLVVYGPGKITLNDAGTSFRDVDCRGRPQIVTTGSTMIVNMTGNARCIFSF